MNVNVSAATFATTLFSPCTAIVLNASLTLPPPPPPPVFEIVTASLGGSVVIDIQILLQMLMYLRCSLLLFDFVLRLVYF